MASTPPPPPLLPPDVPLYTVSDGRYAAALLALGLGAAALLICAGAITAFALHKWRRAATALAVSESLQRSSSPEIDGPLSRMHNPPRTQWPIGANSEYACFLSHAC